MIKSNAGIGGLIKAEKIMNAVLVIDKMLVIDITINIKKKR